jgi:hypothetical protein
MERKKLQCDKTFLHSLPACTSMLILLLGAGTMYRWAMLPIFKRNTLPPSSGIK